MKEENNALTGQTHQCGKHSRSRKSVCVGSLNTDSQNCLRMDKQRTTTTTTTDQIDGVILVCEKAPHERERERERKNKQRGSKQQQKRDIANKIYIT